MSNIIPFPKRPLNQPEEHKPDPLSPLKARILKRFNVTYEEYTGLKTRGKRTLETQAKIDRALHKETLVIASQFVKELNGETRIDS